jgi:hypothetical protein
LDASDENRHLDVKREVNFRTTAPIDRYWQMHGMKKRSADREKHVLEGVRQELGPLFVGEVDGPAVDGWYRKLTQEKGIDRNPADQVEVKRPDDARER